MNDPKDHGYGILPLLILVVAGFTFNTSELIPIGLLSDIASDFGISEARAGLLITVYAWVVATMSLPLMLLFARMNFRTLMTGVVSVFFLSHILTVLSTGYYTLMFSRIGVALAHSLFWSIAPAMAVAVMPREKRAAALSALVAGGGVALILGLPLGRVLGLVAGWRMAFAAIAVLAALILLGLRFRFPSIAPDLSKGESRKQMIRSLWQCRPLVCIYIVTVVIVTGHYTGYSYIEPFMAQIVGMGEKPITLTLSLFGVAGLTGSFLMSRWYTARPRLFILASCFGLPVMMLLVYPCSMMSVWFLAAVCIFWGMAMTIFNIAFQNEIVGLFPGDSAVPMSFYSGIFNLGIGAGAMVGGWVCDAGLLSNICSIGGGISLCAAVFCLLAYIPRRKMQA